MIKLKHILINTRKWAEKKADKIGYDKTLSCMCAIVSKKLFRELKKNNIKCQIAINSCHCFIIINKKIIDLTATQFFKPKIYIKDIRKLKRYWKMKHIFNNDRAVSNYQKRNGWPLEQISLTK